jgi:hypothetical protein
LGAPNLRRLNRAAVSEPNPCFGRIKPAGGNFQMYCPECGTQNVGNVKFCRACGRDLETVALALTNKLPTTAFWLEKQGESMNRVVKGSILLGASVLIGVVPALFIGAIFPLLMLWTVFFGWMAAWGIVSTASGLGGVSKSKMMLRHAEQVTGGAVSPPELASTDYQSPMLEKGKKSESSTPASVTEHTTKQLDKYQSDI